MTLHTWGRCAHDKGYINVMEEVRAPDVWIRTYVSQLLRVWKIWYETQNVIFNVWVCEIQIGIYLWNEFLILNI